MRTSDLVEFAATVEFAASGLIASGRSRWELLFILAGGFLLFRVLENGKRRREGQRAPGAPSAPTAPRASAAEQEDDAVAWWFTSGRYGGHDPGWDEPGADDLDGPDRG